MRAKTIQNTTSAPKYSTFNKHSYREYVKLQSVIEPGYSRYQGAKLTDFNDRIRYEVIRGTKKGFFVHGQVGVGKSHLLHAHYRTLPRLVRPAAERDEMDAGQIMGFSLPGIRLFIPTVNLLAEIRDCYRKGSEVSECQMANNMRG